MERKISIKSTHWYALKVFFNRVFEIEDYTQKQGIESYFPCEKVVVTQNNGKKKKVCKPIISSLFFFRSTEQQAIELQLQWSGKVMLYTKRKGLTKIPIQIPDKEMEIFMLVSSSGEKGLEYFGNDNVKFYKGEHVRVIDGAFKGAEGYICRIKGNHRLVVAIQGVCAVATSYIPQCFLQKI